MFLQAQLAAKANKKPAPAPTHAISKAGVPNEAGGDLTLKEIISERPPTKTVRKFMADQLKSIKSDEEKLFDR